MRHIYAFDFLRFVLALCVVLGHAYINLFMGSHCHVIMQNLAVDGFFVLSGFLLAKSCQKLWKESQLPVDLFRKSTRNRIKRLYPEYVFAICFTIIVSIIFGLRVDYSVLPYNLLMVSQINGVPGIVNGSWYVSVLFWAGAVYVAMLLWWRMGAVRLFVPLIVFFTFCYCYSTIGHLVLHGGTHMAWGWLSSGMIKGFMAMGVGIVTYFVCRSIEQKPPRLRINKTIFPILEVGAIALLVYCFAQRDATRLDFLVYAAFPILIAIYYFGTERITRFFARPFFAPLTDLAYMLFLTHVVILEVIKHSYIPYRTYPRTWAYIGVVLLCIGCAYLCRRLQKWLELKMHTKFVIDDEVQQ